MKAPTTRFALIRTALVLVPMALAACASTETGPKLAFETPMWAAERYDAGVVAADHPEASGAGAEILGAGGNAVDAAVATSFALSVVRPYSCGIGGGGFMVIHLADHPEFPAGYTTALNYRERAPGLMGPTYFEDNPEADSRRSGHAVGVPGTVAGLLYALEKYGTMDRAEVLAPAIRLARRGFAVDANFAQASRGLPGSDDIREGGRHRNPMQARALQLIADRGAAGFYEGELAEAIVGAVRADGGPLTFEDLARYRVSEVQPLEGRFLGRTVFTMPPPSSGGLAALQTFGVLERLAFAASEREGGQSPLARPEPSDPVYAHALLEALKHAFADRARWLGDPEFSDVPTEQLLAPSTLDNYAMDFDPAGVLDPLAYGTPSDEAISLNDSGTSHLSVVDARGNAVACTETINTGYGSRILVPGYGFYLNNEIDDFLTVRGETNFYGLVQSDNNLPAPGKRPLSSMTPMVVLGRDGGVELVAGASGGPRIITGTIQTALHAIVFGDDAWTAVARPRVHHQWSPDSVTLERGTPDSLRPALEDRGHAAFTTGTVGVVQAIVRDEDGRYSAASDPRKGGAPAGP